MLDILHNGVTKKVNGSPEDTKGLLVISGRPRWFEAGDGYSAMLADPRITPRHIVRSAVAMSYGMPQLTNIEVVNGFVRFNATSEEYTSLRGAEIICELYSLDAATTPSGIIAVFNDVTVSFTNWNVTQLNDEEPIFAGTVAAKIEDDRCASTFATVAKDSFYMTSEEGNVSIEGINEILPDGQIICNVQVEAPSISEDPVLPTSVTDAAIDFAYIANDNIRVVLPEVDVTWRHPSVAHIIGQPAPDVSDVYETTISIDTDDIAPDYLSFKKVITVRGENGEEFPVIDPGDAMSERTLKMFSWVASINDTRAHIDVMWTGMDTEPETTKLAVEMLVANYGPYKQ